jgi:hypothetical protein
MKLSILRMLAVLIFWGTIASADEPPRQKLNEQAALQIGIEAYLYGYPIVLMDVTRQVATAVPKADEKRAPVNQFHHSKAFPDHSFTAVVSPNADTLYSTAWLDLLREPIILSVPDTGKRYYLIQMLDAWTNVFAAPGTRTTGNGKGDFAVVGPAWTGQLPKGVKEIKSPTNMVWIIGRTQTNGKDDYPAVHAIQRQYKVTPLGTWGKEYQPPDNVPVAPGVDTKTSPAEQVAKMDTATFLGRLAALMKDNPPAPADAEIIKKLAAISLLPGKDFDFKTLDPAVAKALERGVAGVRMQMAAAGKEPKGKLVNGWMIFRDLGRYGNNYLYRAAVAWVALGANLPEDAIYMRTTVDADGQPLTGKNRYVLHFPKGQTPPVNAFWSVTMYNSRQAFVENPIGRYASGDRDKLKFNADGSLDLYIQPASPGKEQEANWLPAPIDDFNLMLRLFWPKKEVLDGTWPPPAVKRQ